MRRTALVARREYHENLRTKAFWIGIFAFPVILLLSILVPIWLEGRKDARRYAVLDRSGWLLAAIDERADGPDLAKVLRAFIEDSRRGKIEALPEFMRGEIDKLEDFEAQLDAVAALYSQAAGWQPPTLEIPEEARKRLEAVIGLTREPLRRWWKSLSSEEARKYSRDLSKARYIRVPIDPAWTDAEAELGRRLSGGDLFAYFVINDDPVAGSAGAKYVSNNLTDDSLKRWFASLAGDEVRARRLREKKIDDATAAWIEAGYDFDEKRIGESGEEKKVETADTLAQIAPIVFVYLLWVSIFTVAQMLLTNTIEEKSNRVIEVLLSSLTPFELMCGKIAGIAATGLTVVCTWVLFFITTIKLLPLFTSAAPPFDLMAIVTRPAYMAAFVSYFVLGYLFFASVFVAIGSLCTTLKEAQNLITPVVLVLIVPLFAMIPIGKDPNGTLARVLSWLPPFTPFVMMNRAAGPPAWWEYAGTTALLAASVALGIWTAGKVFRFGILMTGKPPRLREIWALLRDRPKKVSGTFLEKGS
jgi:ABC-2 type transport system permease protein